MKKIIKTLGILLLIVGLCACGPTSKQSHCNTDTLMGSTMKGIEYVYNTYQVDSMCIADTLKPFENWLKTSFYDYETKKQIVKSVYMKKYSTEQEIIYTIMPYKDTFYKVMVRTVKNEE